MISRILPIVYSLSKTIKHKAYSIVKHGVVHSMHQIPVFTNTDNTGNCGMLLPERDLGLACTVSPGKGEEKSGLKRISP